MKGGERLVTAEEMRELDRWAIDDIGIPALCLMENAGRLVAEQVRKILQRRKGRRVCILCGPGNNGGDGFVAARYLWNTGVPVTVLMTGSPRHLTPDAAINFKIARRLKIPIRNAFDLSPKLLNSELAKAGVVVDALFGVGLSRDITGQYRALIESLNASGKPVVAIDVPSGLDGTTGRVWGVAVKACSTVTLACAKKGLFTGKGPRLAGRVLCVDIGIPRRAARALAVLFALPLALFLFPFTPASAAPAFVQITENSASSADTVSATFGADSTTGNLIVVALNWNSTAQSVSSLTDNKGNTYTSIIGPTDWSLAAGSRQQMYYAKNITGGSGPITITVAMTGTTNNWLELYAAEYSGLDTVAPLDQSSAGTGETSGTADSGSKTTTQEEELIIGHCESSACSEGAGFTPRSRYNNNVFEDKVVSSLGSYNATAEADSVWVIHLVTFKSVPSVPGKTTIRNAVIRNATIR